MGVNVAFDLMDNTDDAEPAQIMNRDAMLRDSQDSIYSRDGAKHESFKATHN